MKSTLKKHSDPAEEAPAENTFVVAPPANKPSTTGPSEGSTGDMVVQLAGEVSALSGEVTELWDFFTQTLDTMTKHMDLLRKDNNDFIEALHEQKQENDKMGKALNEQKKETESLKDALKDEQKKTESLEKRLAEMEAWVKDQKDMQKALAIMLSPEE